MNNSYNGLYRSIVLNLKDLYSGEEARAMADRLFEHYFGLSPAKRVLAGSRQVPEDTTFALNEAVAALLQQVPIQYVLGTAYFMDMEFEVNPSVLIPRPETEELLTLVLKECTGHGQDNGLRILDIGTGSGCIAIALKRNLPGAQVTAIDISERALEVAAGNAVRNQVAVNFALADILDPKQWPALPCYDLIVSNPPYVTFSEKQFMLPNVLDHEPHTALFVPDEDPLLFYRAILDFAKNKLAETGSLWFEINEIFGNELRNLAFDQGFSTANIIFDFHGKSRFLQCHK